MYLLDTFALICLLSAPERMKRAARERVADPAHRVLFSPANIWEIEIKATLGKLARPAPDVVQAARSLGLIDLRITAEHAAAAGQLPPHHRDPFDRMLVAQARSEDLAVVTPDALFAAYDVPVLRC